MLGLTRIIFATIGVWFQALILLYVFPVPIISGFAPILSLPVAVVLMILTLISLIAERNKLGPVVCAAGILVVFFIALPRVMYWGALAHLYLHKQTYETKAQRMLAAQDEVARKGICGDECFVLESNLVAFHYVHGFLNWHDIVYDPHGKVLAMKSWDEKKRFNMYFVDAEHLAGDWYLGHFGD